MTRLVIDAGACKLLLREFMAWLRGASRFIVVAALNYPVFRLQALPSYRFTATTGWQIRSRCDSDRYLPGD
jgi:hypothetical protein